MSQDFVRYSPDVERADPDFEQSLQMVLESDTARRARLRDDQCRREYFVMPSLSALSWIGDLAETSSIEQKER